MSSHGKVAANNRRDCLLSGDCDNALEIYYDPKYPEDIEIGGVLASTANWREILLPMLAAITPPHLRSLANEIAPAAQNNEE